MDVTGVKIYPTNSKGETRAYADITFDNCFCVRDFRLLRKPIGYVLFMPEIKQKDGSFREVAHSTTAETLKMIEAAVIAEYTRITGES